MKQTVTFDSKVYSKGRKGFNFPMSRAEELGYKRGKSFRVDLIITNPREEYRAVPFTSGTEIRTPGIFINREFGDEIRVTARKSK
jgi:hypothetical protein